MASWYLAPSLVKLRQQINSAYRGRDRSTDGAIGDAAHNARKSDHNADWDSSPPGIVRAIDIDKDLLGGVTDPSVMQGLVNKLIQDPRTAYVIYRSRIWQNPAVYRNGGWRSYIGKPVGAPNPHNAHAHVSIRHNLSAERSTADWPLNGNTNTPQEDKLTPELSKRINDLQAWVLGKVDDLAKGVDQALDRHLSGDRRRTAFQSAVQNGVVSLTADGPYYAVEFDGSLTPISSGSFANFRRTPLGAKLQVQVLPPSQHADAKKRMNSTVI